MTGVILLILCAITLGLALRRIGTYFDARRGDTVVSDALASSGFSLLVAERR